MMPVKGARRLRRLPARSLRYLFRWAADPLFVDPLVGAVFFDLRQGLVDGLDEGTLLWEGDAVLRARGDDLDELQIPAGLLHLHPRGRAVVDHAIALLL